MKMSKIDNYYILVFIILARILILFLRSNL